MQRLLPHRVCSRGTGLAVVHVHGYERWCVLLLPDGCGTNNACMAWSCQWKHWQLGMVIWIVFAMLTKTGVTTGEQLLLHVTAVRMRQISCE